MDDESDWDTTTYTEAPQTARSEARAPRIEEDILESDEDRPSTAHAGAAARASVSSISGSKQETPRQGSSRQGTPRQTPQMSQKAPQPSARNSAHTFNTYNGDDLDDSSIDSPRRPSKSQMSSRQDPAPPYDFQPALSDPIRQSPVQATKRSSKEDLYSKVKPRNARVNDRVREDSWDDDTDEDERTRRALHVNYQAARQRESAVEKESPYQTVEPTFDELPPTARSTTSLTSFGKKKKSNQKQTALNLSSPASPREISVIDPVSAPGTARSMGRPPLHPIDKTATRDRISHGPPPAYEESENRGYVYPLEDGTTQFLQAKPDPQVAKMQLIADKAESYMTRGLQEFFGVLRLVLGVFVVLVVELIRFVLRSLIRPIVIGLVDMLGDYVLKPFLSAVYNGLLQPMLVLLWNMAVWYREICGPLIDVLRMCLAQCSVCIRLFRLVEVNITNNHTPVQTV